MDLVAMWEEGRRMACGPNMQLHTLATAMICRTVYVVAHWYRHKRYGWISNTGECKAKPAHANTTPMYSHAMDKMFYRGARGHEQQTKPVRVSLSLSLSLYGHM